MAKGHVFYSRHPTIDLCSYDGFHLLSVEMDHRHGGGSLALCHRGGGKSDAYPCRRRGARRRHGETIPFAWIRRLGWLPVMADRLCI
jgi:hypothetical protein